jgi:DNA-binding Lrp family transcriptional regulator
MLDQIDRKILTILEADACMPADRIATMLGIEAEEARTRIAQLEQDKIIVRRRALINWEKTDEDLVWALIEVRVSPQREVGFDSIARRIARFPEARSVYLVSGTYDLAVQVVGRSLKEVANFVAGKLAPLAEVQGTTTHFLLKRYKDDGVMLGEHEEPERLPVTP